MVFILCFFDFILYYQPGTKNLKLPFLGACCPSSVSLGVTCPCLQIRRRRRRWESLRQSSWCVSAFGPGRGPGNLTGHYAEGNPFGSGVDGYHLDLPWPMKINHTFHASWLKPVLCNTLAAPILPVPPVPPAKLTGPWL